MPRLFVMRRLGAVLALLLLLLPTSAFAQEGYQPRHNYWGTDEEERAPQQAAPPSRPPSESVPLPEPERQPAIEDDLLLQPADEEKWSAELVEEVEPQPAVTPWKPHWSGLPLFGEVAADYGLPLPMGIGFHFNYQDELFELNDLSVRIGDGTRTTIDILDFSDVETVSETYITRFDLFLLPFLDVYGLLGYTRGTATGRVSVPLPAPLPTVTFPFDSEYEGFTYGGGVTLSAGYGFVFASGDFNYTQTQLEDFDEPNTAMVAAARVGIFGDLGWPLAGAVWAGVMYQDTKQRVAGTFELGGDLPPIEYEIEEEPKTPLNIIAGLQWDLWEHLQFIAEGGFGDRKSMTFGLQVRF